MRAVQCAAILLLAGMYALQDNVCLKVHTLGESLQNKLFKSIQGSLPISDTSLLVPRSDSLKKTNCIFYKVNEKLVVSGINCTEVPSIPRDFFDLDLTVQEVPFVNLKRGSFESWWHLQSLHVTKNMFLTTIDSKAFLNLTNLINLTITSNPNLENFSENSFEGLINLMELSLIGNKILRISQIAKPLAPIFLPKLIFLDLRENNIPNVGENDFVPMENSTLQALILSSTETEYIHEKAYDPLNNLVRIIFTQNKINGSVAGALINNLKRSDSHLNRVSLAANPLYGNQEPLLQAVADSNITYMDISNTYFLELKPGFFPSMPNLEAIDISNILIRDIPKNVINATIFPKLAQLHMSRNNLRSLTDNFALPTLEKLDLSYINFNNLAWNVVFKIDPNAFTKMPRLNWLSLQGTRLDSLTKDVFSKAVNLLYLSLSDSTLSFIDSGSFLSNNKLQYLDLSKNSFPIFQQLEKDLFLGLSKLLALDISYCHITHFNKPDIFMHLRSLQYLSLRMNSLQEIDPGIFMRTPCLISVDLRYNTMISWNEQIFKKNRLLSNIFLDYNHLSTITEEMLSDFSTASAVRLKGNSIICNCHLVNAVVDNFDKIYKDNKSFASLPFNSSSDLCVDPPNQTIVRYLTNKAYTYECQKVKWPVVLSIVLITLSFITVVLYVIYRNYKLSINFAYLTVKERLGLIKFRGRNVKLENLDGTMKDAFVSYSSEDESFVEKMVYILESEGFDLLLYKRDFNVGDIIPDKILESIESSRKTILVLSESFAKSEWCLWEMYIAQNRSIALIRSDQEPLLLIKKTEIDETVMTPTLKHLLKTRVYLQWHESPFRQKIFWHQLKLALKPAEINTQESHVNT